ncbi:MAG: HEAT repeat domain-containing protein [Rhodoglobus sp.]
MPEPEVPVDLPIEKRIAAAVKRFGEDAVVTRSISLIAGNNEGEDFLLYVGGEHARGLINGAPPLYWPELWGMRALLTVWNESAIPAVTAGLQNQAWRVREMSCRVSAVRGLAVSSALTELLVDEVPRVRAAAARALGAVGSAADVDGIRSLLKDPEIDVRRGAQEAISALRTRFPEAKAE